MSKQSAKHLHRLRREEFLERLRRLSPGFIQAACEIRKRASSGSFDGLSPGDNDQFLTPALLSGMR
jgi:hypothetical protein